MVFGGPSDESTSSGTGSREDGHEERLLWLQQLRSDGSSTFHRVVDGAVIGRDASCDLVLEGRRVSRKHLRIRREGPLYVAADLGSKNGTFINGCTFTCEALDAGSVLRLGDAVLLALRASARPEFGDVYPGVLGGTGLRRALRDLESISRASIAVSIVGATGTGKEGVARAIHERSGRLGAFVAVNCATISDSLADSQLFGHKRGAFTGASSEAAGYFAAADGGTLFLDEVSELPLSVQAKLLRVLQEREYCPVGSTRAVSTDVRIVTAGQRTLSDDVGQGAFREDLAARLVGYEIKLPLLCERREDIGPLFVRFVQQSSDRSLLVHPKAMEVLLMYAWPGNVRELQQVALRAATIAASEGTIEVAHLPASIVRGGERVSSEQGVGVSEQANDTIRSLERALKAESGNVQRAAESLGISRGRAYRLLARAQLDVRQMRADRDGLGASYVRTPGKLRI